MNPTQRRGILLISVAIVGAVGIFFLVSNYVADVRQQLGPTVAVLVSTQDLAPLATPDDEALSTVEIPTRWLPPNALRGPEQVANRITATDVPADTILSEGMFIDRPALEPGEREVAIMVDAETAVAGKITTGSVVDVFATFAGREPTETTPAVPQSSRIVLQRAQIIEVGSPVDAPTEEGTAAPGSVGFGSGQQVPVTFRLSIEDANRLVYVESFASSVRLALRSPLDQEVFDDVGQSIFDSIEELGRAFDPVDGDAVEADDVPLEDTAPPTEVPGIPEAPAEAPAEEPEEPEEPADEPEEPEEEPEEPEEEPDEPEEDG